MATQVLIAHTGQRLQLDASQLTSIDGFKAAVARQTSIPVQCIIALGQQGKAVKPQTMQTEKDIFIYDNRITQASSPGAAVPVKVEMPLPKRYAASNPPDFVKDTSSIGAWQDLFTARRTWALKVAGVCEEMARSTQARYNEMDAMLRCLDAAVANTESVVKALEPKYIDLQKWVPATQQDYDELSKGWEQYLSLARSVPISPGMVRFMTGRDVSGAKGRPPRQATLEDLIDLETARKAGRVAPAMLTKFRRRVVDLEKAATRLFQDSEELFHDFEKTVARSTLVQKSEVDQLLDDIEPLVKKMETDYQTTLKFCSSRDVSQASKIAAVHTERILPALRNSSGEMDDKLRLATQARNALAVKSAELMRGITDITSLSESVKSQINAITREEELNTFDFLRLIQQVPYVYASFLAEAVKRREWYEKVRQDSSTLANEMALFQDEEAKRRRRWFKSVGEAYGPEKLILENNVPGLEVNVLGEDDQWPPVAKQDMEDLQETLRKQNADQGLMDDMGKLMAELNNPTKQQTKRIKAFKNGSVHEAAWGRSGLLIRGDDDLLRTLQDDKAKLEGKLKTAESRVRRLEDLLHRQSQASRPNISNIFQMQSQHLSDRNDSTISVRAPRTTDDRGTSMEGTDNLVNRVQLLEAELAIEKARSAVAEKTLDDRTTEHNDMKGQVEEVNSTKRDLLENMEALKREFVEERKSLEDDIKNLRARLEYTEEEIEDFGVSRENEKVSYDEKVQNLELEVDRLTKAAQDEALKNEGQVEFLREEARLQHERVEVQEKEMQTVHDEMRTMTEKITRSDESAEGQQKAIRHLYEQLCPGDPRSDDTAGLLDCIGTKMAEMADRTRDLQRDVSLLKSELEMSHANVRDAQAEVTASKAKLAEDECTAIRLRESLSEGKAKVAALEGELADGRDEISQLHARIADGETGSESLRKKLEEHEEKMSSMTEELASRQSQVGSLEEELRLLEERLQDSQTKLTDMTTRFECRTERTRDLTQRLYSQNDRLTRLLERLGFAVTRQGDSMTIQKVPRSERSSQNANEVEASMSLRRSGTLTSRVAVDKEELELLHWTQAAEAGLESEKYEAFMSAVGLFDMDAFVEAVYRRVRDVEHLARKLQRDARSNREKVHGLQKEAHDKIAYKHFREGDLALFLPTRNQTTGAWAAFNVGFPHYFLREQEAHRLRSREWLLARITRVQERVVDLSKSLGQQPRPVNKKDDGASLNTNETESLYDEENDNPFDLSDGLRWYLIDAHEDKTGAPATPGLGKSTVAANKVEAMADMHHRATTSQAGAGVVSGIEGVSKSLSKSLESRRSSTGSKKALPSMARGRDSALASETNSLRAAASETPVATSPTTDRPVGASEPVAHHTEVRHDVDSLLGG